MTNTNDGKRRVIVTSDGEDKHGLGRTVMTGILAGSLIAVVMIAGFCIVSAAMGQWNQGMTWCVSAIAAGILGGLLQQLWFGYSLLVRPSYPMRIAGFGLTYFVVLAVCAALGGWLPEGMPIVWLNFSLIYLIILAVITACFTVAFRRQGASYTERLEAFREQHGRQAGLK